jgi:hydrogenase expression/formation protein HypD
LSSGKRDEAHSLLDRLADWKGKPLTFMEVCGTHTVAAARAGLPTLLPPSIRLISGPGCPVCVTPVGFVDRALALCALPEITVATFGDLVRVPGSSAATGEKIPPSLSRAQAEGADLRVVYSPLDALEIARGLGGREVVFLSVGFETTTPTIAAALLRAVSEKVDNFSVLAANKTIVPALELLGTSAESAIDGFLCPGHVSVIIGADAYRPLAERHRLPCAIAGFEPVEMLRGIAALTEQVARGRPRVDNCYPGAVRSLGNPRAREITALVFEACDAEWRGIGVVRGSGMRLRAEFAGFDAFHRFPVEVPPPAEASGCRCGEVLRGVLAPKECVLFGRSCTPETPRGACMVSSEGSCAAHYHYSSPDHS